MTHCHQKGVSKYLRNERKKTRRKSIGFLRSYRLTSRKRAWKFPSARKFEDNGSTKWPFTLHLLANGQYLCWYVKILSLEIWFLNNAKGCFIWKENFPDSKNTSKKFRGSRCATIQTWWISRVIFARFINHQSSCWSACSRTTDRPTTSSTACGNGAFRLFYRDSKHLAWPTVLIRATPV